MVAKKLTEAYNGSSLQDGMGCKWNCLSRHCSFKWSGLSAALLRVSSIQTVPENSSLDHNNLGPQRTACSLNVAKVRYIVIPHEKHSEENYECKMPRGQLQSMHRTIYH